MYVNVAEKGIYLFQGGYVYILVYLYLNIE